MIQVISLGKMSLIKASILPPALKKGQTVGLMCPAGYMHSDRVQCCVYTLGEWGFQVRVGKTVGAGGNYFSGSDDERREELQAMLDDDAVHAILFARGGYGLGRIIDYIDFRKFKKHPKWLIGFSDITVLHAHIHTNLGVSTLHAPMAGAFNDGGDLSAAVLSLQKALRGVKGNYTVSSHPFNHPGEVTAPLVGGNLALLAHLVGSRSQLKTEGRILFLEDVGEYLYNIDRMLHQLKRAGMLSKIRGLVIGGFTDCKDTERPFGKTVDEIFNDLLKPYTYPVCYGFPVSHDRENMALKCGALFTLHVGHRVVRLKEA
jgi:muramoyltetrapeptide carboxypeptidase